MKLTNLGLNLLKEKKLYSFLYVCLCVVTALAEAYSVYVTVPFIKSILAHSDKIRYLQPSLEAHPNSGVSPFLFVFVLLSSSFLRIFCIWSGFRLSARIVSSLSAKIFANIINQTYRSFQGNSKDNYLHLISQEMESVSSCVSMFFQLIAASFVVIFVFYQLLQIDIQSSLATLAILIAIYIIITITTDSWKRTVSSVVSHNSNARLLLAERAFEDIRHTIVHSKANSYVNKYAFLENQIRITRMNSQFLASMPRFAVETAGIVCVSFVFTYLINKGLFEAIPIIGSIAVASQKLLPAIQQCYYSYSEILHNLYSYDRMSKYMYNQSTRINIAEPSVKPKKILFPEFQSLELLGACYSLPHDNCILLNNVSMRIDSGDRIAVIGPSGSGKSTLIDILMGLIQPTEGSIVLNGTIIDSKSSSCHSAINNLQCLFSHVPQEVNIYEDTLLCNVTDEDDPQKVDWSHLELVAEVCCLNRLMSQNNLSYNTILGLGSVLLSGGEKQMLGIARALYLKPKLLFLDEATSSMDIDTEHSILSLLFSSKLVDTVCMITHNRRILHFFNKVVCLGNGTLVSDV